MASICSAREYPAMATTLISRPIPDRWCDRGRPESEPEQAHGASPPEEFDCTLD